MGFEIQIFSTGDWIAIYVNGELKAQNHSLRPQEVLDALNMEYEYKEIDFEDGHFPDKIEDLKQ